MFAVDHSALRLRAARLDAAARRLAATAGAGAPFRLVFMTDRRRIENPEPVMRALPRGAAVIYRDYDDPRRAPTAHRYAAIARGRGLYFLVGGDAALAAACGADGVHWPAGSAPSATALSLSTWAAHGAADLDRAAAGGASAVLLSPVFPTRSHMGAPALGPDAFLALARDARFPVFALGGVTAANAKRLAGPNVAGIAAIGAFAC